MADDKPTTFQLEVATPERLVLRVACTDARIPALQGYIGMRPGHAQWIAELGSGELAWTPAANAVAEPASAAPHPPQMILGGGFVEISADKAVILADSAEWPGDIDPARALAALERAQEAERSPDPGVDHLAAARTVQHAQARLAAREQYTREHSH
ncbi:MAG: FoF1 ATP synthase subunit delta/epsilon [Terriglobales bacterium]